MLLSQELNNSKDALYWIANARFDEMRQAPKQPLAWTGAPIDALPVVQSIQRTLEENCDAMMFMYNLTVSLLNERKRRAHLGRVEEATIDRTAISSEVRQQAEQGGEYTTFFLEQSRQWQGVRAIKQEGAKDKAISGFIGYRAFVYRKPLYEHTVSKARKAPVLTSRCNVLRLATSGYAEPWFFDHVPGEGRVELDAADLEAPSEAPYVDYAEVACRTGRRASRYCIGTAIVGGPGRPRADADGSIFVRRADVFFQGPAADSLDKFCSIFVRRIVDDRVVDDRVLDATWESADNDCTRGMARESLRLVTRARGSQFVEKNTTIATTSHIHACTQLRSGCEWA